MAIYFLTAEAQSLSTHDSAALLCAILFRAAEEAQRFASAAGRGQ